MKLARCFSILILLFAGLTAHAEAGGSGAGNGGDIVYCENSAGVFASAQMLDVFEANFFQNRQPTRLQGGADDAQAKLLPIIADIAKMSPLRAARYTDDLKNFMTRVTWVQHDLEDIPDSLHIVLPVGCRIRQLAIQDRSTGMPQYTIDQRLWNSLDNVQRAALIMHEIVYGEALDSGAINSIGTRNITAFLMSESVDQTRRSTYDYFSRLALAGFFQIDFGMKDGSVVLLARKALQVPGFGYAIRDHVYACGFVMRDGTRVDYCRSPQAMYGQPMSVSFDSTNGITGFTASENGVVMPGERFGLQVPVSAISFGKSFVSTADFAFKNANSDVVCTPGYAVELANAEGKDDRFDFTNALLKRCGLQAGRANRVKIFGRMREVSFLDLYQYPTLSLDTAVGTVYFATPQTLTYLGQTVSVQSVENDYSHLGLKLAGSSLWKFPHYSCSVTGEVTHYKYQDGTQWKFEFARPCHIPSPAGDLEVNSADLNTDGFPIDEMKLSHVTNLQFGDRILPLAGEIRFTRDDHEHIQCGQLGAASTFPIEENTFGQYYHATKPRQMPAGVETCWSDDTKSYSVYGIVTTATPFAIALLNYYIDPHGGLSHSSHYHYVKVVGEFEVRMGMLEQGTLAEDAVIPVKVVYPGRKETIDNRKIKAGAKIRVYSNGDDGSYQVLTSGENQ